MQLQVIVLQVFCGCCLCIGMIAVTSMDAGQVVTRQIKCACDSLQNHCMDEADYCISNYTVSKKKDAFNCSHYTNGGVENTHHLRCWISVPMH